MTDAPTFTFKQSDAGGGGWHGHFDIALGNGVMLLGTFYNGNPDLPELWSMKIGSYEGRFAIYGDAFPVGELRDQLVEAYIDWLETPDA